MNKKSIEEKFSRDIDAYLKGIKDINESKDEQYNGLLELGKALANKDFSGSSNKEVVFSKTVSSINKYKGDNVMKNPNKIRRIAIAAISSVIVCGALTQTSFAKGLAEKIIKTISIGHINAIQIDSSKTEKLDVPDKLKGKIFDKDGNPIKVLSKENKGNLYTANGEKIVGFANGKITTEKMMEEHKIIIRDSNKLNEYTCFNVKIPSYLPNDYKFDKAEIFKDDKGVVSKKYINLYFNNEKTSKFIFMQQRVAEKETEYTSSTDGKIEKVKVNGVDAILYDNRNIDWEANKVLYSLSGRGEITKDELIKVAESIK